MARSILTTQKSLVDAIFVHKNCRVHTGHGKPGKSWNLRISFFRLGKSSNLIVGPWKMKVLFGRLVTADDKGRTT